MVTFQTIKRRELLCPSCKRKTNYVDHTFTKAMVREQMWADDTPFSENGWEKGRLMLVTKGKETYKCPFCGYEAAKPEEFLISPDT